MRLTVIFIFLLIILSLRSSAQKFRMTHRKISLSELFMELKAQTGYGVIWNEDKLNANKIIDVNFRNADLAKVMQTVLHGLPLTYSILDKIIVIVEKPDAKDLKLKSTARFEAKGTVLTDEGLALQWAVISKKNDGSKTFTDQEGIFALPGIAEGDTLHISYVGYETKTLIAANEMGHIRLHVKIDSLDEVQIVSNGYQNIPKERVTGSFSIIDTAQLNRRVNSDFIPKLDAIASGLLINKDINNFTGRPNLSLRGRSTIYANDQPLVILDNFPFEGDLSSFNPNDIASITLLKDAAAAAIWGVRAGNGVIVIKTKRAKNGQPLRVSLNTSLTVSGKPDIFYNQNFMSASDFIDIETFLFKNGQYDQVLADKENYKPLSPVVEILNKQRLGQSEIETNRELDVLRNRDVRNEELQYFYRPSVSQQHALSLSGSSSKTNHYFSVGYDKTVSSVVGNSNDRITLNSQNTFRPVNRLELDAGIYYVRSNRKDDITLEKTSELSYFPYSTFKDANGDPAVFDFLVNSRYKEQALNNGFLDWDLKPLNELGKSPTNIYNNNLRVNTGASYSILNGLKASIKYQNQSVDNKTKQYIPQESFFSRSMINQYSIVESGKVIGYNIPLGEVFNFSSQKERSNSLRGQLDYQKNWGKHSISGILGYEFAEYDSNYESGTAYGYNKTTGTSIPVDTVTQFNKIPSGQSKLSMRGNPRGTTDRIRSSFANVSYTYNEKYTLTASARVDGSNYFGVKANQKYIPLWSAGGLWHLDRENFYQLDWLPVMKLRASYGYNGNLEKGNTGITTFGRQGNDLLTGLPYAVIGNIGNPDLKWERIGIANFGLEFGLKRGLINGKIEYYFKQGFDILGDKSFPSSAGITQLRGNYAEIQGNGIDITITSRNLTGVINWNTNILFSMARDKVSAYDYQENRSSMYVGLNNNAPKVGKPIYGVYSYKSAGLDPQNGDPRGYMDNLVSKDYSGIVSNTDINELIYNGPARPTIFGAIANTLSWRRFTLGVNVSYKLGYYFRKGTVMYSDMYRAPVVTGMNSDYSKRWQKQGDEAFTDVPSMDKYPGDNFRDLFYANSSANVARGDHIRLQDMSLSFDMDKSIWADLPFKQVHFYLYANNLGIIWKANDFSLDPDLLPSQRHRYGDLLPFSLAFGMKINF